MQILQPTLIEYSSPAHRNGIRKYFKGQYKIDYSHSSELNLRQLSPSAGSNTKSKGRYILYHDRCHTQNLNSGDRCGSGVEDREFRYWSQRKGGKARQQQFQTGHTKPKGLDIKNISKTQPRAISLASAQNSLHMWQQELPNKTKYILTEPQPKIEFQEREREKQNKAKVAQNSRDPPSSQEIHPYIRMLQGQSIALFQNL